LIDFELIFKKRSAKIDFGNRVANLWMNIFGVPAESPEQPRQKAVMKPF
jgi:hypothetical protein